MSKEKHIDELNQFFPDDFSSIYQREIVDTYGTDHIASGIVKVVLNRVIVEHSMKLQEMQAEINYLEAKILDMDKGKSRTLD